MGYAGTGRVGQEKLICNILATHGWDEFAHFFFGLKPLEHSCTFIKRKARKVGLLKQIDRK